MTADPIEDPLAHSAWSRPETVAGFTASPPNTTLMEFAQAERGRSAGRRLLDLGCGAGRNAVPLAEQGWQVFGVDLSLPMLRAAMERAHGDRVRDRVQLALAPMDRLPVRDDSCDLIVAHGIWNLAASAAEFGQAVYEAARVARRDAALFVFTFSRHTLPDGAEPVVGESFVFTQFSGAPQCFLTEDQLIAELSAVGFVPDPAVPLRELNRAAAGALPTVRLPVIWEGTFRYRG